MLLAATALPAIFPGTELPGSGNKSLQAGSFSASAQSLKPPLRPWQEPFSTCPVPLQAAMAMLNGEEEMPPAE